MFMCQMRQKVLHFIWKICLNSTYQTSSFIIMKINCCSRVLSSLKRIHVLFRNSLAKIHIVTTSSPKPTTTPWNEQFKPIRETRRDCVKQQTLNLCCIDNT